MLIRLLQFAAFAITTLYFGYWRVWQHRLNTQSWEALVSMLDQPVADSSGRNALWAMYRRSGVLLRVANRADRDCPSIDPSLVSQLRSDAILLRMNVLLALARGGKS